MIRAQELVKEFASTAGPLRAVDGLSLEIEPGEIYGLLGPNGAGKTTAMRMLSGLLRPTSGTAVVGGFSVTDQPDEVRARIGILTEVPGLYARLTPTEYLDFYAQIQRLSRASTRAVRIEELLRLVGLWERRNSVMRTFSKGMQQRVAIARTLIHDPAVLLFDEPTAALDPEAARTLRDYVRDLAHSRGRTVLLCTHNLSEAEQLCQRLSIIQNGRQIAEGAPRALMARLSTTYALKVRERTPALMTSLAELPALEWVSPDGPGTVLYQTRDPAAANPLVIRTAVASGADVLSLGETPGSLEDVYLTLIRSEEAR